MSYIVFVLGALLAIAGGLSVYDGSSIITLERGWAEVIAGSVALTGGIVTIGLAMVLHKLQALHGLYKTSVRVAPTPADSIAVAPPFAAKPPAVKPPAIEPPPVAAVAPATPPPLAAVESNAGQRRDGPGLWPPAARPAYTPEPEPLEETVPVSSAMFEEVETSLTALNPPPVEEAAMPQTPRPSAAALSLDEMWKRVTEEIDRPIFPPEREAAFSPPPVEPEVAAAEHPAEPDAPVETAATIEPEPQIEDPTPEPVEEIAAEAPAAPNPAHVETPAEELYTPPVEPPMAEPAVIGRYEAEGTSYLMFADGSIEAQSEAGIFRFASMAELKAFIEDRQAVEP
ncbi:hypothetical protein [Methyloferula stellata]|uniref:hypothetical protein n=1 Tax=Methyloferula stellata TaxID=876270 RepID=UPI00036122AE|nr:hypothetical protein [Methyloferula stellata]